MTAQCAMLDRPLTMDDLPELLPVVVAPRYESLVGGLLGGELIVVPETLPSYLPARAARQAVAALAGSGSACREGVGVSEGTRSARPETGGEGGGEIDVVVDGAACGRLLGFLAQVADRRDPRGVRYGLPYLLALPVVAMTAYEIDLAGIGEWVAQAPEELVMVLGAPLTVSGQARRPDTKTITEALTLHQEDYDLALCAWIGALARERTREQAGQGLRPSLHVDGKAQKKAARGGRAPMLLAARRDDGTVAAQRPVPVEKTNEITVFAPLLDQLDDTGLDGTVITADQLHTQREHALYLHSRGAFYVFTVGGNQPKLFAALDELPWKQIAVEAATVDRAHGRIEIRTIHVLPVTDKITALFPHAAQAFLLERHIYDTAGNVLGIVAVLGVTSLPADQTDGTALLTYVRGHWSVESLHWLRDRIFGEDNSLLASASHAMAALRNTVIGILSLHGITTISKALRACRRSPYQRPLLLLGLATPTRDHPETAAKLNTRR